MIKKIAVNVVTNIGYLKFVVHVLQTFYWYCTVHVLIPNPRGARNPRLSAVDYIQLFLCRQ